MPALCYVRTTGIINQKDREHGHGMAYQHGDLRATANDHYIRTTMRYILDDIRGGSGNLLVAGAGDGPFEHLLRERECAYRVTSFDMEPSFREDLEAVADRVIIDDFLTHEFDETYDVIVCVDVLEHVIETDAFLQKAHSVLKPGGTFYLQTPNLASWHGRLTLLFGFTPEAMEVSTEKNFFGKFGFMRGDGAINHVRIFTYRALREMCTYYGFAILKSVGVDHRIPYLFNPFPGIAAQVCLKMTRID